MNISLAQDPALTTAAMTAIPPGVPGLRGAWRVPMTAMGAKAWGPHWLVGWSQD